MLQNHSLNVASLLKETPKQVFSSEFWLVFQSSFYGETPLHGETPLGKCFWKCSVMIHKIVMNLLDRKRQKFRSSYSLLFYNVSVFKDLAKSTAKQLCWSHFLIRLQTGRLAVLLKINFSTGIFLWILWNF